MSGGTFGGVVRNETGWTSILDFEKADAAVDPSITTTGGDNWTRVGGAGGTNAYMHVRKFKPVPSRGDLYQLTV